MLTVLYVVTAIDVLVAAGFAITGLLRPSLLVAGPTTEPSRIFAQLAAARALPLALVTLAAMAFGTPQIVQWIGTVAGLAQLADFFIIGFAQKQLPKAIGPLIIAVAQGIAILLTLQAGIRP